MKPFSLPQPVQPVPEQKAVLDVVAVLKDHVAYTAAARADTRLARLEIKELTVKISELSDKVTALIGVATTLKTTADSAANHAADIPEDDPEIEALGRRIDDAIAVLQGVPRNTGQGFTPAPFDPNAPV